MTNQLNTIQGRPLPSSRSASEEESFTGVQVQNSDCARVSNAMQPYQAWGIKEEVHKWFNKKSPEERVKFLFACFNENNQLSFKHLTYVQLLILNRQRKSQEACEVLFGRIVENRDMVNKFLSMYSLKDVLNLRLVSSSFNTLVSTINSYFPYLTLLETKTRAIQFNYSTLKLQEDISKRFGIPYEEKFEFARNNLSTVVKMDLYDLLEVSLDPCSRLYAAGENLHLVVQFKVLDEANILFSILSSPEKFPAYFPHILNLFKRISTIDLSAIEITHRSIGFMREFLIALAKNQPIVFPQFTELLLGDLGFDYEQKVMLEIPKELKCLRSLKCGDIGRGSTLVVQNLALKSFECGNLGEDATCTLKELKSLTFVKCGSIHDRVSLNFEKLDSLKELICGQICSNVTFTLSNELQGLEKFVCKTLGLSAKLIFPKKVNFMKSLVFGEICDFVKIDFPEEVDSMNSLEIESLRGGELPLPNQFKILKILECKLIGASATLTLPKKLPFLKSLLFGDVWGKIANLPEKLDELEKITFRNVHDREMARQLISLRNSVTVRKG